ncbi:MAG: hypothetical protein GXP30_05290 [Verrucomicrobia bacterium]|nr:hypothetical protein [Verrucomicrobiota bacterium]
MSNLAGDERWKKGLEVDGIWQGVVSSADSQGGDGKMQSFKSSLSNRLSQQCWCASREGALGGCCAGDQYSPDRS